jgi:hypothetical protein
VITSPWRERSIYAAMSAFVAWHATATILAPAPDNSVIAIALRPIFQPYLSLFRLDNTWDFFAPSVENGAELRYIIEDAAGKRQTFTPTRELSWYHPNYFWHRSWYYAIMDETDTYAAGGAEHFCRKHAALRPVAVTFAEYQQSDFAPEDQLDGKHPWDSEFVSVNVLKRVPCPRP